MNDNLLLLVIGGVVVYYLLNKTTTTVAVPPVLSSVGLPPSGMACPTGQAPYRSALGMGPWICGPIGTAS